VSGVALLTRHLVWADGRLWGVLREVPEATWRHPFGASHGDLAGTVAHLAGAEWVWLERLRGRSPASLGPEGDDLTRRARLEALWPQVWEGLLEEAARPEEEPVAFRTTQGIPHRHSRGEILLHVALHSAAYRGQATALLRQAGYAPPATDLVALLRQGPAGSRRTDRG
jgi:uncharacterized damage-inducible protein DinB